MNISTTDPKNPFIALITNPYFTVGWFIFITISYFSFDKWLAVFMHYIANKPLSFIADIITQAGGGRYYLIAFPALIIVAYFVLKDRQWVYRGWLLLLSVVIPGLICDAIKPIVGRTRPALFYDQNVYGFHWFTAEFDYLYWSFPSGHATTISGVMTACVLLWPRWWKAFVAVLVIVGLSRVAVDAHFLSDVMAGMWLGAVVTVFIYRYFVKRGWLKA